MKTTFRFLPTLVAALGLTLSSAAAPANPPASEWLMVSRVKVKPGASAEYARLHKAEVLPALQRTGIAWFNMWTPGIFGAAFEYHQVIPIEKFALFDEPHPLTKALGKPAHDALRAKLDPLVEAVTTYAIRSVPSASYEVAGKTSKIAVLQTTRVAPGREAEYRAFLERELLPVVRKSDANGFLTYETVFGGAASEFVTLTLFTNYAEIDRGSPQRRVLGEEGARQLMQKLPAGVILASERTIIRHRPDLSIQPAAAAGVAAKQ